VRYLRVYDNALLSHQDRSRVFSAAPSPVLVDGYVVGWYKIESAGTSGVAMTLLPTAPIPRRVASELEAEGIRLLEFLAPDARPIFEIAHADWRRTVGGVGASSRFRLVRCRAGSLGRGYGEQMNVWGPNLSVTPASRRVVSLAR
jgi:hypothetical protein